MVSRLRLNGMLLLLNKLVVFRVVGNFFLIGLLIILGRSLGLLVILLRSFIEVKGLNMGLNFGKKFVGNWLRVDDIIYSRRYVVMSFFMIIWIEKVWKVLFKLKLLYVKL